MVNAGADSPGPDRGPAGAVAPPPVHRQDHPQAPRSSGAPWNPGAPWTSESPPSARASQDPNAPGTVGQVLAWLPYLLALGLAAAGLVVAWQGSKDAGHGAGLVGCALLMAAVFRLALPSRYAAPLSSRGRAPDVLAFALFGAGVLVLAVSLP